MLHLCSSNVAGVDMSRGNPAMRIPEPLVPVVKAIIGRYNASVKDTQNEVAKELMSKLEELNNG